MKCLGAGLALLGLFFAQPVLAADMAARTRVPPPAAAAPASSWTGFYVGGDLGGAWSSNSGTFNPLPSAVAFGAFPATGKDGGSSFLGGFHAGYNYQFAPAWVAGLEGDWSWTKAKGSFSQVWVNPGTGPTPGTNITLSSQLDWMASVRGRLGYLVTPNVLAYATGGAAWAKIQYAGSSSCSAGFGLLCAGYTTSATPSSTEPGYVLGGGLEWALTNNWLVRAEYLYYRFHAGPNVVAPAPAVFAGFPSNFSWNSTHVSVARGGVSYKF